MDRRKKIILVVGMLLLLFLSVGVVFGVLFTRRKKSDSNNEPPIDQQTIQLVGKKETTTPSTVGESNLFVVPSDFNLNQAHNSVDAVVYINLAEREDRKLHIEKELEKLNGIYKTKERIDAVKHKVGAKGCARSHIKALNRAKTKGWKNVLIVEDDLIFHKDNASLLISYATRSHDFDVLLIAGNIKSSSKLETVGLAKPLRVQTTSCYLVKAHYYDVLIDNFLESDNNLKSMKKQKSWAIDRNWFKLQRRDNWLLFEPTLARQRPDYSNIEKKQVDYGV